MKDDFYRSFEDRLRGSRELIKERLRVYMPFVEGVNHMCPRMSVLDLGCGRGEWLELMTEYGLDAKGVDTNAAMLDVCEEMGLSTKKMDAIEYLKVQNDQSFGIISAFHFIEHISFSSLQDLMLEARRVLKPGGILIMETPNPENVIVATNEFYLDPTHRSPVPPLLLSFLSEFYEFERWEVIRLQEPKDSTGQVGLTLTSVFQDVSPDYAVIAQTSGNAIHHPDLDTAFQNGYGYSLRSLTERFDNAMEITTNALREKMASFEQQRRTNERMLKDMREQISSLEQQRRTNERMLKDMREQVSSLEQRRNTDKTVLSEMSERMESIQLVYEELRAVRGSLSWRVTAPLRRAWDFIRRVTG